MLILSAPTPPPTLPPPSRLCIYKDVSSFICTVLHLLCTFVSMCFCFFRFLIDLCGFVLLVIPLLSHFCCLFCIRPAVLRGPSIFCYLFVFSFFKYNFALACSYRTDLSFVLFMSCKHVFISLFVRMLLLFSW